MDFAPSVGDVFQIILPDFFSVAPLPPIHIAGFTGQVSYGAGAITHHGHDRSRHPLEHFDSPRSEALIRTNSSGTDHYWEAAEECPDSRDWTIVCPRS